MEKKNGKGQEKTPKKGAGKSAKHMVTCWFSTEMKQKLTQRAEQFALNNSSFVRMLVTMDLRNNKLLESELGVNISTTGRIRKRALYLDEGVDDALGQFMEAIGVSNRSEAVKMLLEKVCK